MELFKALSIETWSNCNRRCETCLRETYPDRKAVADRYEDRTMPSELVTDIIDQVAAMSFDGTLILSHFNEPLMDRDIAYFADYAKGNGLPIVHLDTNGDFLNEDWSGKLDGVLTSINVAIYEESRREQIVEKCSRLFTRTKVHFVGKHVITPFSPFRNMPEAVAQSVREPCIRECQARMIIAYTGEMMLCCCDLLGFWDLGSAKNTTLHDLWFGDKHREIVEKLEQPGGRWSYPLCRICPRPSGADHATRHPGFSY